MRVLVCGDRHWQDKAFLFKALDFLHGMFKGGITLVIEGEAPGADRMAREWAEARGIRVRPFPANWERFGKAAGPLRNKQMLLEGRPSRVVAFHAFLPQSVGTKDMLTQARKAGVKRYHFTGLETFGEKDSSPDPRSGSGEHREAVPVIPTQDA